MLSWASVNQEVAVLCMFMCSGVCTVSECSPGTGDTGVNQADRPLPEQLTSQRENREWQMPSPKCGCRRVTTGKQQEALWGPRLWKTVGGVEISFEVWEIVESSEQGRKWMLYDLQRVHWLHSVTDLIQSWKEVLCPVNFSWFSFCRQPRGQSVCEVCPDSEGNYCHISEQWHH